MPRPTPIFAVSSDLQDWLGDDFGGFDLAFTLGGMFETPIIATYQLDSLPNLGTAVSGNQILEPSYLIHDRRTSIEPRGVPQRKAGVRYSIDQRVNTQCVGICFGGRFEDDIVIAGQIGNGTEHPESQALRSLLLAKLKKRFTFIQSYWVGPAAAELLDAGARLTINARAATEYDLVRPMKKRT